MVNGIENSIGQQAVGPVAVEDTRGYDLADGYDHNTEWYQTEGLQALGYYFVEALGTVLAGLLSNMACTPNNISYQPDVTDPDDTGNTIDAPDDTGTKPTDTYTDDTGNDTGTLPDVCDGVTRLQFNLKPFVIEGVNANDASQGLAVASGNLNGDEINDLVLGFQQQNGAKGQVYGIFGGSAIMAGESMRADTADIAMSGTQQWEGLGSALALSSDFLFIGSAFGINLVDPSDFSTRGFLEGGPGGETIALIPDVDKKGGRGELVVGGSEFAVIPLESIGSGTQSIDAIMKYYVECPDYQSVDEVSAGDMDGDGLAEVAFGDSYDFYYGTGKAYLVKGGSWNAGTVTLWPDGVSRGADFFTVTGGGDVLSVGAALAMGDVDEDNLADLLIGAPGETNGHDYSGGLHKLSSQGGLGSLYGQVMQLGAGGTLSLPQSVAVYGGIADGSLPDSVTVVNDAECGLSAVVAGVVPYGADANGRVFVLGAKTLASLVGVENAEVDDKADQEFTGEDGTGIGYPVVAVGDVNGDGIPDFATTAPMDDLRGQVYVYLGEYR